MSRKPHTMDVPRERDDQILRGIQLVLRGYTYAKAAEMIGMKATALHVAIERIMQDDVEMSGEDFVTIKRVYP